MIKHLFIPLLLLLSDPVVAQKNAEARKDSLRKVITNSKGEDKLNAYRSLGTLYFGEIGGSNLKLDTLLGIYGDMIEEAKRQENTGMQGLAMHNMLSALFNRGNLDEVFKRAPKYLDYLAGQKAWKHYYVSYSVLLNAYLSKGEIEKAISEAQTLYEQALQRGHNNGVAMALYAMSQIYGSQRRSEEEEKAIRQCIEAIKDDDTLLNLTANAYHRLCQTLLAQERFDELPGELAEFEQINRRYEQYSKEKQPTTWLNLWSVYARYYLRISQYDKAETYCEKMESMPLNIHARISVYKTRAEIYEARGQYDQSLEMADKAMELLGSDKVPGSNSIRGIKIQTLIRMGRAEEAYELFRVAAAYNDSVRNVSFNKQLDELRTIYDLDKVTAEKEYLHSMLLLAVAGGILLLLLLGLVYYNYYQKRAAYRVLVERIRQWAQSAAERSPLFLPGTMIEDEGVEEPLDAEYTLISDTELPMEDKPTEEAYHTLFEDMHRLILSEQLFRNPDISQTEIARRMNINRTYLSQAVNRQTGKNFSTYLNEFRIKEAVRLMSDNAQKMSLEGIAYESGFNDRKTFYVAFKKITGLSPSVFRDNLQKKQ